MRKTRKEGRKEGREERKHSHDLDIKKLDFQISSHKLLAWCF